MYGQVFDRSATLELAPDVWAEVSGSVVFLGGAGPDYNWDVQVRSVTFTLQGEHVGRLEGRFCCWLLPKLQYLFADALLYN